MSEYDAVFAEFYDLSTVGGEAWPRSLRLPPSVLARFRPDAGPLVDLGAGTGLSTVALADAAPLSQVYALEPVQSMRAVLMSRLVERADLRRRVTVLAGDIASVGREPQLRDLPERWGGATARGLLGQIDPQQRARLWQLLAERMAEDAVAVIDRVPSAPPTPGRHEIYRSRARQGDLDYETVIEAGADEQGRTRAWLRYRVLTADTDELVREELRERTSWPVHEAVLRAELAAADLVAELTDGDLLLVCRR